MKPLWRIQLVLVALLLTGVGRAQDVLPPEARKIRDEIDNLVKLTEKYAAGYHRNVNTLQQQLDTIELFDEITVDGETVVIVPGAEVALFLKYFRGFSYLPEGSIDVSWSLDGEEWLVPIFWWKAADGRQARLACGVPNKDLHLRFAGQGRVRSFIWKALSPISLEFDPEPFLIPGSSLPELAVEIRVAATEKMAFNGDSTFDRRKWLRVYSKPDAVCIPDFYMASQYFVERGFAASRDAGYRLAVDPDKTYSRDHDVLEKLERLYPEGLDCVVCFDVLPEELQCTDRALDSAESCPDEDKFSETAERIAATLVQREQRLGEYAGPYCEVKNESDIGRNWGYFTNSKEYDAWRLLAEYHNHVARAVKRRNPGWKVGGPSSCLPLFDSDHFERGRRMLEFAERTCSDLDYYSWHFYERNTFRLDPAHSYLYGRLPASIDLYRSHLRKNGGEKPLLITEYGGAGADATDIGIWTSLRSINQLLVQMMDYPDVIDMAVPFVIPVSWWHKNDPDFEPDSFRLFTYDEDKNLELTKLGTLLELWRGVDGVRVPVKSSLRDVNVMACRNGSRLYVALSNRTGHRLRTALEVAAGGAEIQRVCQRRLYVEQAELNSRTDDLNSLEAVPVAYDETTILVVELGNSPEFSGELNRKVFCAEQIMQPTGEAADFTVDIPEEELGPRDCLLRLGLWRQGCFSGGGTVTVNGRVFRIPGFSEIKTSWFGIREIEIPADILEAENKIAADFPDGKGLITSVVLYSTYQKRLP